MSIQGRGVLVAVGLLGAILVGAAPAWAQSGHSGGGHAPSGGHVSAPHGSSGGAPRGAYGGGVHYTSPVHYAGGVHATTAYRGAGYGPHGAYGYPGGHYYGYGYGHGYYTGAYWRGGNWGGGYWGGGYWPRAYYGAGFSWFLPILPLAYATYWYSGVPYYYANDVYYTYNPSYAGYVATDPPPIADSSAPVQSDGAAPTYAGPPQGQGANAAASVPGQIYMYPKNGQSPQQQASDKAECQQWAASQAGQVAQNGSDYQRAMVACVEGRGYSAQ